VLDPGGKFGYLMSEMGGIVTAFTWDGSSGKLREIQQTGTLPPNYKGSNHSAEIAVHPNGKFLYQSNRRRSGEEWGPDDIHVYSIDPATGKLSFVEKSSSGGVMPRYFTIDPTGSYLFAANQFTGNVVPFRIDVKTGKLSPAGAALKLDAPVCLKFVPAN
jgi:6-phosphogluconolactonase